MIRKITTKCGELLADVQLDKNQTLIIDPSNGFKTVAVVASTNNTVVLRALQKLGTLFNKKMELEKEGVRILDSSAFIPAQKPSQALPEAPRVPNPSIIVRRGPGRPRKNPEMDAKAS